MIVIDNYVNEVTQHDNYVALGSFDGLHKGHISLIKKTVEIAKENNGKSMVFTFKNHPKTLLSKNFCPAFIMSNEKKIGILKKYNIDIVCFKEFDSEFMKLTPEEFIKMLVKQYNVKGIIVGFNHRFGYKNLGDAELLKKMQSIYDYKLYIMKPYLYKKEPISSTRIRNSIIAGELVDVNDMLDRYYTLSGKVVRGRQIGRIMGFPTANLSYDKKFVLPKVGVYYTKVFVNNNIYKGITNIGDNPTVNGKKITVETYILEFNNDIYGKQIELSFVSKIRDMKKFNSLEELKNQLQKDKIYACSQK